MGISLRREEGARGRLNKSKQEVAAHKTSSGITRHSRAARAQPPRTELASPKHSGLVLPATVLSALGSQG